MKLKKYFKEIAQMILVVAVVSVVVDYVRRPTIPLQAATTVAHRLQNSHENKTLAQLSENKVLVLYFWGSWCGICRHTSPVMEDLHRAGVPVLGVAWHSGSDDDVRAYLAQHGWTFDSVNDDKGEWARQWGIQVTPSIVLIKNGKVLHTTTGLATYWGLRSRIWWFDYVS